MIGVEGCTSPFVRKFDCSQNLVGLFLFLFRYCHSRNLGTVRKGRVPSSDSLSRFGADGTTRRLSSTVFGDLVSFLGCP